MFLWDESLLDADRRYSVFKNSVAASARGERSKPEACPHRSRWLSAREGATPPERGKKPPDPEGITDCCDPSGVDFMLYTQPVVATAPRSDHRLLGWHPFGMTVASARP